MVIFEPDQPNPLMTVEAFTFFFNPADMQRLLDTKPGQVVCVVSIEEVLVGTEKRGALKIIARGPQGSSQATQFEIEGCPRPPCQEQ